MKKRFKFNARAKEEGDNGGDMRLKKGHTIDR
jgi:hypothetical protein